MTNWPTDDMDSSPFNKLRNEGKIRGALEQVLGRPLTDADSALARETAAEIDQQNHRRPRQGLHRGDCPVRDSRRHGLPIGASAVTA